MFDLTIALLGLVVVQELIKFILLEFVSHLGHWFLFLCFRSEKIQNLMREGAKKTYRKKNIPPIFGKANEGDT